MKYFVLALFVGVACAQKLVRRAVHSGDADAPILRSVSEVKPDGYNFVYETGNGIFAEASGSLKKVSAESEAIAVQGQYKYTSPEGESVGITYVADENGYQPQGSHIPVPPPVPEAILRSLKYIAEHPAHIEKKF